VITIRALFNIVLCWIIIQNQIIIIPVHSVRKFIFQSISGFTMNKLSFSQIKEVIEFCNGLHSEPDWREVVENIVSGSNDFEVDNVRFISTDEIDQIQCDEMESDTYILGCFNARALSDATGIDQCVFEAMQKADAYDAIGKLVISLGKLSDLQQQYCSADGYGHHFNSYDGGEEELRVNGTMYHVFDNH